MNRRAFFGLLAAPAIIRVATLMPVRALPLATFEYEDMTATLLKCFHRPRVMMLTDLLAGQEAALARLRAEISAAEDGWFVRDLLFPTDAHSWLEET